MMVNSQVTLQGQGEQVETFKASFPFLPRSNSHEHHFLYSAHYTKPNNFPGQPAFGHLRLFKNGQFS